MDLNNRNEEEEMYLIENQSDELEKIYKEMEHYRRENILFENYLNRLIEQERIDDINYQISKNLGRKFLTSEEKFEIANMEAEILKKNIEEGKLKSDEMIETLKAILEETDMSIKEIKKDALDFQRDILDNTQINRNSKTDADAIVKYREEKLKQKDILISKYKLKKTNLDNQIYKLELQLKKKEEMGDDLKFIDFHQLQIENKKYVKEIDEKNNKLIKLKLKTGNYIAELNGKKELLKNVIKEKNNTQSEINRIDKEIKNIENEKDEIIRSKDEITKELDKLKAQKGKIKEDKSSQMNINNFIKEKNNEKNLLYGIKNLERKIEIFNFKYNEALKYYKIK